MTCCPTMITNISSSCSWLDRNSRNAYGYGSNPSSCPVTIQPAWKISAT